MPIDRTQGFRLSLRIVNAGRPALASPRAERRFSATSAGWLVPRPGRAVDNRRKAIEVNIDSVIDVKPNPNIGRIAPGDTVRVSVKVVEGDRERIQSLEGTVIRMRKGGAGATLTIRRMSWGVGVEHIFPVYSPRLEKVELLRKGKVRRAKLYYLRGVKGKLARIKEGAALKDILAAEAEAQAAAAPVPEAVAEAPQLAADLPAAPVAETTTAPQAEAAPPGGEAGK